MWGLKPEEMPGAPSCGSIVFKTRQEAHLVMARAVVQATLRHVYEELLKRGVPINGGIRWEGFTIQLGVTSEMLAELKQEAGC